MPWNLFLSANIPPLANIVIQLEFARVNTAIWMAVSNNQPINNTPSQSKSYGCWSMSENDIKDMLMEKSQELKSLLEDMSANLDKWRFSIEDTKEGTRVEIEIHALIKKKK